MLEKSFIFNQEKWELCADSKLANEDINSLPIAFVILYRKEKWIWCPQHKNFEKVLEKSSTSFRSEKGCMIHGIPAFYRFEDSLLQALGKSYKNEELPVRWRIFRQTESRPLILSVDILLLRFRPDNNSLFSYAPTLSNFSYLSYSASMQEGHVECVHDAPSQKEYSIPDEVADIVLESLKDDVEKQYGIRPTTETSLKGKKKINAFLFRPFEINSYAISEFLFGIGLDDVMPKDCMDGYQRLCKELSINSPKGLHKIYTKNPYALVMYRIFQELGFSNYDLMLPFFEGTRIGLIDIAKKGIANFPCFDDPDVISQAEIYSLLSMIPVEEYYEDWKRLAFLTKWLMEIKGENWVARRLLKYSVEPVVTANEDICKMLYKHFDKISDRAKELFIQKGFSHELHELLVEETNQLEYGHEELQYLPYERDFECEINGYRFELPTYTDDISKIGVVMQNCVASYLDAVCHKKCTIVALRKEEQYVACIEIRGDSIIQALGFKNEYLQGEPLDIINFWKYRMMLGDRTEYLYSESFYEIPLQSFQWQNLPGRHTFFLYDLEGILSLPKEEIKPGYYRALGAKLYNNLSQFNDDEAIKHKYMYLLNDIPTKRMADEKAFLHAVCPALDSIVEAAYQGNGEAQWVLSDLYGEYSYGIVPENKLRCEYWKKKAEASGEPGFPKLFRHRCDLS